MRRELLARTCLCMHSHGKQNWRDRPSRAGLEDRLLVCQFKKGRHSKDMHFPVHTFIPFGNRNGSLSSVPFELLIRAPTFDPPRIIVRSSQILIIQSSSQRPTCLGEAGLTRHRCQSLSTPEDRLPSAGQVVLASVVVVSCLFPRQWRCEPIAVITTAMRCPVLSALSGNIKHARTPGQAQLPHRPSRCHARRHVRCHSSTCRPASGLGSQLSVNSFPRADSISSQRDGGQHFGGPQAAASASTGQQTMSAEEAADRNAILERLHREFREPLEFICATASVQTAAALVKASHEACNFS